ncbi:MAG: transposase [Oscillospiraceae bacterium]|nr:transposase [Oscillospiraceae bacterium]
MYHKNIIFDTAFAVFLIQKGDEKYDCYICPNHKTLQYSTTNREVYREYKSKAYHCEQCSCLEQCTHSKDRVNVVMRHVWQTYVELADDWWYAIGMKEVYQKRKETMERIFADGKDTHGMRYTQLRGLTRIKAEVGLRFACMNLKNRPIGHGKHLLFRLFAGLLPLVPSHKPDMLCGHRCLTQ